MNFKQKTALSLILVVLLAGCGTSSSPITADQENVNRAKVMRDLYTKYNGNYDSMSAAEKEQFRKVINPSMTPEKAWAALAPQKVNMGGGGDPRTGR